MRNRFITYIKINTHMQCSNSVVVMKKIMIYNISTYQMSKIIRKLAKIWSVENRYSHTLLVRLKIGLGFGETICYCLSKCREV